MSDAALQIAELRAALAAQTASAEAAHARAQAAEAELAQARALASCTEAMIQELKLEIAKLRRDKYGISSERRARLIDQLELQLEELEAAATEDALAAEVATAADTTSTVRAFTRRKPVRKPFPDHLPRERVVVEAPTSCTCCGSDRIVKMGEDIREEVNRTVDRMTANELACSAFVFSIILFQISTKNVTSIPDWIVIPFGASLAMVVAFVGHERSKVFRRHMDQVEDYLANIERALSSQFGWTNHYRDAIQPSDARQTGSRRVLWHILRFVALANFIFQCAALFYPNPVT
jgi:hypothetical protein